MKIYSILLLVLLFFTNYYLPAQNSKPLLIKDTLRHDAVYLTFQEFKTNKPLIPYVIADIDLNDGKFKVYRQTPDSARQEIKGAWGLCINNEIYLFKNGALIPLEKQGDSFVASAFVKSTDRKNQANFWRNVTGRFNGRKNNPYSSKKDSSTTNSIYLITKPDSLSLNMETGTID